MIEKIQFWAVLLWMIGMLVMAVFAVRAVWIETDRGKGEPEPDQDSKAPEGSGTDQTAPTSAEPR